MTGASFHLSPDPGAVPQALTMPLAELMQRWAPGSFNESWTWAAEDRYLWEKDGERMRALLDDIAANGVREPIVLGTDGRVWDGHHRVCVAWCLELDVVPVAAPQAASDCLKPGVSPVASYNHHGCRCDRCSTARREYLRRWRLNRMQAGLSVRGRPSKRPDLTAAAVRRATVQP